jgi:hypothetical protein
MPVFLMLLASTAAHAQMIPVRDAATIDVPKGGLFSSGEPTREIKEKARAEAKMKAWARYKAQNASGARAAQFAQHDKALLERLENGLCTFSYYDEEFDKAAATFHVKVRGNCDQKAVDAALESIIRAAQGGSSASGSRSAADKASFTFVFFARRAADAKEFLDKSISERSVTATTMGTEASAESSQSNRETNVSASQDAVAVSQSVRTETKGTIQRRDTKYDYVVVQSEAVDNAVSNVLVTAGFEVTSYSDVAETCPGVPLNDIIPFFAKPGENQAELIPPPMRTRMYNAARQCEQHFFAVGLLDILKSERQPDGTELVTVALTVDVRDIKKRVPTKVAAIPTVQFRQKGRDRIEAANAALTMAAETGTREIVDILRKQGLQ